MASLTWENQTGGRSSCWASKDWSRACCSWSWANQNLRGGGCSWSWTLEDWGRNGSRCRKVKDCWWTRSSGSRKTTIRGTRSRGWEAETRSWESSWIGS
jgi:hypothetical protein